MKKILFSIAIFIGWVIIIIILIPFIFRIFHSVTPVRFNDFIIENFSLKECDRLLGCDEIREIPKTLQNKKIVFKPEVNIFFEPSSSNNVDLLEIDSLGFLKLDHNNSSLGIVNPSFKKEGYLKNREYMIIRAAHHYNCFYCLGGSDYSYIIIEDKDGNRFFSFLDDYDWSTHPATELLWDEYEPYYMKYKDSEGNDLVELIDI